MSNAIWQSMPYFQMVKPWRVCGYKSSIDGITTLAIHISPTIMFRNQNRYSSMRSGGGHGRSFLFFYIIISKVRVFGSRMKCSKKFRSRWFDRLVITSKFYDQIQDLFIAFHFFLFFSSTLFSYRTFKIYLNVVSHCLFTDFSNQVCINV